ncbi:hypothetical protein LZ30DRAFT_301916 [Colletotrichum cereale]|nr:hypothetical protein LZ30DRAFT_301916 [Colletotrichum cereale]
MGAIFIFCTFFAFLWVGFLKYSFPRYIWQWFSKKKKEGAAARKRVICISLLSSLFGHGVRHAGSILDEPGRAADWLDDEL